MAAAVLAAVATERAPQARDPTPSGRSRDRLEPPPGLRLEDDPTRTPSCRLSAKLTSARWAWRSPASLCPPGRERTERVATATATATATTTVSLAAQALVAAGEDFSFRKSSQVYPGRVGPDSPRCYECHSTGQDRRPLVNVGPRKGSAWVFEPIFRGQHRALPERRRRRRGRRRAKRVRAFSRPFPQGRGSEQRPGHYAPSPRARSS